tara:strand:+ start:461 stop:1663 length:1203 start_codon:yes stop_codon:yes gene_type:complete
MQSQDTRSTVNIDSLLDEDTHQNIFFTTFNVSHKTGTPPSDLIKMIIEYLPKKEPYHPLSHGGGYVVPENSERRKWDKYLYNSVVNEWVMDFIDRMSRSGFGRLPAKNFKWSTIRSFLEFYVSNVRIFYDKKLMRKPIILGLDSAGKAREMELDEIIQKKDEFIESEIKRVQNRVMCMETKLRSRERGFGKEEKITSLQTAPHFWVTQFNEEMEFKMNPSTTAETNTPPPPNWVKFQRKKKPKKRNWATVTRADPDRAHRQYMERSRESRRWLEEENERRRIVHEESLADQRAAAAAAAAEARAAATAARRAIEIADERRRRGISMFARAAGAASAVVEQVETTTNHTSVSSMKGSSSQSVKKSLREAQTIIDEEIRDLIPEGIYLNLVNKMKETFDHTD